jgi:N-acetylglucosamine-6-phosphate deacetylase
MRPGLIADGFHADPAAMAIALRGKRGPGRIFLVSDAMATIGTTMTGFTLAGHHVRRQGGRLVREDNGTLAGADITLHDALCYTHQRLGIPLDESLRMATLYPAQAIGRSAEAGTLQPRARADILHLSDDLALRAIWQGGVQV